MAPFTSGSSPRTRHRSFLSNAATSTSGCRTLMHHISSRTPSLHTLTPLRLQLPQALLQLALPSSLTATRPFRSNPNHPEHIQVGVQLRNAKRKRSAAGFRSERTLLLRQLAASLTHICRPVLRMHLLLLLLLLHSRRLLSVPLF